jgi:hypothetical protein
VVFRCIGPVFELYRTEHTPIVFGWPLFAPRDDSQVAADAFVEA